MICNMLLEKDAEKSDMSKISNDVINVKKYQKNGLYFAKSFSTVNFLNIKIYESHLKIFEKKTMQFY